MKGWFQRAAVPVLLLFVLFTMASCAVNPVTGRTELMLISESEELALGSRAYADSIWSSIGGGGEYDDPALKAYLSAIVRDIQRASHRPGLPVTFAIQNSSVPNAWALPGHVVITRGLLVGLESEAEFAFVMGHEIGHVSARHTARQLTYRTLQAAGLALAGAALSGRDYGEGALAMGAVGSELLLLRFSRADELEADHLGVEYMAALGYDPAEAVAAHRNLERTVSRYMESLGKSPRERGVFEDLLSTHPRTSVRIEEISRMAESVAYGGRREDPTGRERFRDMTRAIRETHRVYREGYDRAVAAFSRGEVRAAETLVDGAIAADPGQPPFYVLKGYIRLRREDYAGAERLFARALDIDPAYQPAYRGRGTLHYLMGDYGGAVSILERAVEIFPGDVSARYYLGMSLYELRSYGRAAANLSRFASARPRDPAVHYYLGSSYEHTGELGAAYTEYLIQLKVAPSTPEGRLAAARAAALKPMVEGPPSRPAP